MATADLPRVIEPGEVFQVVGGSGRLYEGLLYSRGDDGIVIVSSYDHVDRGVVPRAYTAIFASSNIESISFNA